jgi:hypothetical protein
MNTEATKEVLNELFSHLERLETQSEAILQFLKEKKRVTDKQLAPYLERAGKASNVRWRAARVRIEHLLLPEHPEEEIKLGKPPQLPKDPSRKDSTDADSSADSSADSNHADSLKDKRTEPDNAGLHDTGLPAKDKAAPTDAAQARPADGKADKPEEKSDAGHGNKEQAAQDKEKPEQKSDSGDSQHATEATSAAAQQEGAEHPSPR